HALAIDASRRLSVQPADGDGRH
ncbi:MAG: hypothetical protein QOJ07_1788, partial [Thermoleophilaceae bacterium]|nr:hypothetical protein [Thermoleophilaceae bacterium]